MYQRAIYIYLSVFIIIFLLLILFITPVHASSSSDGFSHTGGRFNIAIWLPSNSNFENLMQATGSLPSQFGNPTLSFSSSTRYPNVVYEVEGIPMVKSFVVPLNSNAMMAVIQGIEKMSELCLTNPVVNKYPTLSGNYNSNYDIQALLNYIMSLYYYIISLWLQEMYAQFQSFLSTELNRASSQLSSAVSSELNGVYSQLSSVVSNGFNSIYSQFSSTVSNGFNSVYSQFLSIIRAGLSNGPALSTTSNPSPSSMLVTSTPPGAMIYLDGAKTTTTPWTFSPISTGSHILKLTKSGYNDYTTQVAVVNGQTTSVNAQLIPSDLTGIQNLVKISGLNIVSSVHPSYSGNNNYASLQQNFYINYPNGNDGYWVQNGLIIQEDSKGDIGVKPHYNVFTASDRNDPIAGGDEALFFTPMNQGDTIKFTSVIQNNQVKMSTSIINYLQLSDTEWDLPSGSPPSTICYGSQDGFYGTYGNPELDIVGPPSTKNPRVIGTTNFGNGTSGQIQSFTQLLGKGWVPSASQYPSGAPSTSESSLNLAFNTNGSPNITDFSYDSGSTYQGIYFSPSP